MTYDLPWLDVCLSALQAGVTRQTRARHRLHLFHRQDLYGRASLRCVSTAAPLGAPGETKRPRQRGRHLRRERPDTWPSNEGWRCALLPQPAT